MKLHLNLFTANPQIAEDAIDIEGVKLERFTIVTVYPFSLEI